MADINLFPLFLSLRVATTATLLAILVGIPIAFYLNRSNGKLADLFDTLLTLPIVLPPTVLGYYLLILVGRQSTVGAFLENTFSITIVFTPTGAVLAALFVSIPFLIKSSRSAFANVDPTFIKAARVLGRSEFNIFFSIILPLAWRGVAAGITLAFARALGDFGATLMVAGSIPNETMTMPIAIYDALLAGNRELANILVIIMTTVSIGVLYILNRLEKKTSRERR